VINFDMPDTVDAYTHRIGRTGRAESTGEALTLATSEDRDMVRDIERVLGAPIEQRRVPGFDYGALDPEMLFYRTPAAEKRAVIGHRTFRPRRGARR
jgi:ATP-dependent RNA helicase RhlE